MLIKTILSSNAQFDKLQPCKLNKPLLNLSYTTIMRKVTTKIYDDNNYTLNGSF